MTEAPPPDETQAAEATTFYKAPDIEPCTICDSPRNAQKAGAGCGGCPAFKGTHYYPHGEGDGGPDILVVGDVPAPPPKFSLVPVRVAHEHKTFDDDAGRVIRSAINKLRERREYSHLRVRYTYGVKCSADNPNKEIITACKIPLQGDISRVMADRKLMNKNGPLVIIACGVTALRSLGISANSFELVAGRVFEAKVAGYDVHIVVTMSMKAIATAVGKYSSVVSDIERAFKLARNERVQIISREELEKTYRYPRTNQEVRELVDEIIAFHGDGGDPVEWAISVDTETNTLHPHRDGLKLLMLSVAWKKRYAAAIVLWHPQILETEDSWVVAGYDPQQAWEDCKRLLRCGKPKIFHNANYDQKVFWKMAMPNTNNVYWDDMLAEHALEEDKKGQYSLKYLVKQFLPEYSGYEDKLKEILEREEGEDQTKSIDKLAAEAKEATADALPRIVQEALTLLDLSPRFRVETLKKNVELWKAEPKKRPKKFTESYYEAADLLLKAKEGGEFNKKKATTKKEEREGGFEKIRLEELCFYACVDADCTRQLAILQRARILFEDAEIVQRRERHRGFARQNMNGPSMKILCDDPHPLMPLIKSRYMPRMTALAKVEYGGVKVDREYMHEADALLDVAIQKAERQIYEIAGKRFNINSGQQLAEVLTSTGRGFEHPNPERVAELQKQYPKALSLVNGRVMYAPLSRTSKGAVQMTEKVLKEYYQKFECPISNLILAFRKATKAKGTFLTNVDKLSSLDGMLHTRYNLNGTSTGRLSSSNMNMQNVPKGTLGGVVCKKLFIPDCEDMVFFNADAKGAEVSIFSAYSNDIGLIKALLDGMDAHSFFASKVLDPKKVGEGLTGTARRLALEKAGIDDDHAWSYEDFLLGKDGKHPDLAYGKRLKKLRDNVKRVVFGILYGAGKRKIAEIVGIDEAFAATIIELLFKMFPTIPAFVEQTKWELDRFGFVETYHGRRRRFAIQNAPKGLIAQAQRRAVNFKVQATNSDIVLDVLVEIQDVIERDLGGRVLLTVHDSIGFQVPKKYATQMPDIMKKYGTDRVKEASPWLPVPYRWDLEAGPSYGEVEPFADYAKRTGLVPANQAEANAQSEEAKALSDYLDQFDGQTEEEMYEDLKVAVLEGEG